MMKQQVFLLCFVFMLLKESFGQAVFHKQYQQPCYMTQLLQTDASGNIYIGGVDAAFRYFVVKLDTAGNVVWDYSIGSPNRRHLLKDMVMLPDQKLIMVGSRDEGVISPWSQTVIICIDTAGQFLYTKTLGDSISQGNVPENVIPDSSGYTISIDSRPPSRCKLVRLDSYGHNLQETLTEYIDGNVFKLYDGSYLLYQDFGMNLGHVDPNFLNASGEYSNSTTALLTDVNLEKVIYSADSGLYALGVTGSMYNGAFIAKISSDLHVTWMKIFSFDSAFQCAATFWGMKELNDKSWLAYGSTWGSVTDCSHGFPNFVMHLDSSFNPVQTKAIGSPGFFDLLTIKECALQDETFLFTAAAPYDTSTSLSGGFHVIKTDSLLTGICESNDTAIYVFYDDQMYGSSLSFNSTLHLTIPDTIVLNVTNFFPSSGYCNDSTVAVEESETKILKYELTISPNPASTEFKIICPEFGESATLEIFSTLSQKIYSAVYPASGAQSGKREQSTVNCEHFPKGIYFVRVSDSEKQFFEKLIVE